MLHAEGMTPLCEWIKITLRGMLVEASARSNRMEFRNDAIPNVALKRRKSRRVDAPWKLS
jgi:hypothetical protein